MRINSNLASALDQAWLSILNLAVSYAFIRFATKDAYGMYLLLLSPLYLMLSLQNALVLSPVATVLPSAPESVREVVHATAVSAEIIFVVIGGLIAFAGLNLYFFASRGSTAIWLPLAFGLAIAGVSAREGARTLFYTRGNAVGAFASDLIYGFGLLTSIGAVIYFLTLTPAAALMAMGIAALWPYAFRWATVFQLRMDKDVLRQFWACGRWALVGAAVSWINLSAYPLIVGLTLSASVVADINVARLFLMPIGLLIAAWSNQFRPKISGWAATTHATRIEKTTVKSISIGIGSLLIFSVLVALLYPYTEQILGASYRGLLPLIMLWSVFFAFNLARTMMMATLMTNPHGYRQLQQVSWIALIVSLGGLFLLSAYGPLWVVGVLIAVEFVQCVLIGAKASRIWRSHRQNND